MKRISLFFIVCGQCVYLNAWAGAGDLVAKVQIANVSSNTSSVLGKIFSSPPLNDAGVDPNTEFSVSSDITLQANLSYYLTNKIATEASIQFGSDHTFSIENGRATSDLRNQEFGKVKILPMMLTGQWHFNPDSKFDPYLGAGVAYTQVLDRDLAWTRGGLRGFAITTEPNMFGAVFQAGLNLNLDGDWVLNADIKYLLQSTEVFAVTNRGIKVKIDSLDVNPLIISLGIGRHF